MLRIAGVPGRKGDSVLNLPIGTGRSILKKVKLVIIGTVIAILALTTGAWAGLVFTQSAFLSGISPVYYLEDFTSFTAANNPTSFSGNGYSFEAFSSGGLWAGQQTALIPNVDLTNQDPTALIRLIFPSQSISGATVYAVGGEFFPSNINANDTTGFVTVTFYSGATILASTNLTYAELYNRPFLGFISGLTLPITEVDILVDQNSGNFPTVDHLYTATVPVPPSALLLGSGLLGLLGFRLRFRK